MGESVRQDKKKIGVAATFSGVIGRLLPRPGSTGGYSNRPLIADRTGRLCLCGSLRNLRQSA